MGYLDEVAAGQRGQETAVGEDGVISYTRVGVCAPRYVEVAEQLRTRIRAGSYCVGEPIPSTARLMAEFHASITIVRAAVNVLRHEGLLIGRPGIGVFVHRVP